MEIKRRLFVKLFGTSAASTALIGLPDITGAQSKKPKVSMRGVEHPWFTPSPPAYPHFTDRNAVIAEAQRIFNRLEQYIKD